jgi:hypothetical protein
VAKDSPDRHGGECAIFGGMWQAPL